MVNEIDEDGNGEIDFDEFVAVMSRKVNANYTADEVKGAFRVFEGGSDAPPHCIRVEHLEQALVTFGEGQITEEQAAALVAQLEPDDNGLVNYVEYVDMMMSD